MSNSLNRRWLRIGGYLRLLAKMNFLSFIHLVFGFFLLLKVKMGPLAAPKLALESMEEWKGLKV